MTIHLTGANCGTGLVVAIGACMVCFAQQPASAPAGRDAKVQVKVQPEFVTVTAGDQPILRYRYEKGPKPYIKELYTRKGVQILLDSPPDHVHHRGLMYAVGVNGINFWEETERAGEQVHGALEGVARTCGSSADTGTFSQQLDWLSPDDQLLLREHRTIQVHAGKEVEATGAVLLTWKTSLELPADSAAATLSGNHYYGLGMRFVRSMDKEGRFTNADNAAGEVFRGDERLTPSKWCAYAAAVDGKPVTVAMFDHPNNVRHPATWFTMKDPFAYLSATLKLHQEPLTLQAGQPLKLTYGIAAWDGQIESAQIDKLYQMWITRFVGK